MYPLIYTVILYTNERFLGVLGSATDYHIAENLIADYAKGHYIDNSAEPEYAIFGLRPDGKIVYAYIEDNELH